MAGGARPAARSRSAAPAAGAACCCAWRGLADHDGGHGAGDLRGGAVALSRRRNLSLTICARASTSRSSTTSSSQPTPSAAPAPMRARDEARTAPSVEQVPAAACCWCDAASRSPERQLDLLEGGASTPFCDSETPADLLRRGVALFLIFSLLAAGRPLRGPLPAEPGAEPAEDRRRLRAGAGDAGAGHCC